MRLPTVCVRVCVCDAWSLHLQLVDPINVKWLPRIALVFIASLAAVTATDYVSVEMSRYIVPSISHVGGGGGLRYWVRVFGRRADIKVPRFQVERNPRISMYWSHVCNVVIRAK
jgi:hypothetical protein